MDERQDEELLTPEEVASQLKAKLKQLREWRYLRKGPPWFELQPRVIRYRRSELQAWIEKQEAATKVTT